MSGCGLFKAVPTKKGDLLLNGNSPMQLLGLYGGPKTRPPRRTPAASLRAPRSTFAAAPDPRAGLSRAGGPGASFKPRGVPCGPRGRLDGLAGCRARLEEGVRARDASRRSCTRYLVQLFEMDRAKTSRAPFQVLRGAIDAPRMCAFDKPAGGVARGLSRPPPPKKRRASEAILPSFDVSSDPARPAGS